VLSQNLTPEPAMPSVGALVGRVDELAILWPSTTISKHWAAETSSGAPSSSSTERRLRLSVVFD
jgi:hypothetical protein